MKYINQRTLSFLNSDDQKNGYCLSLTLCLLVIICSMHLWLVQLSHTQRSYVLQKRIERQLADHLEKTLESCERLAPTMQSASVSKDSDIEVFQPNTPGCCVIEKMARAKNSNPLYRVSVFGTIERSNQNPPVIAAQMRLQSIIETRTHHPSSFTRISWQEIIDPNWHDSENDSIWTKLNACQFRATLDSKRSQG